MEWPIALAVLLGLIFAGIPIGFALSAVGLVGVDPPLAMPGQVHFGSGQSYTLSVVLLFLLMGDLVVQSGIASEPCDAANA